MGSHNAEEVEFPKKERDVLDLLSRGTPTKRIAGELEVSPSTVRERIARSCVRAQVGDETELRLFLLQNPLALVKGARCTPGLHLPVMRQAADEDTDPCACGFPGCPGWVEMMRLKRVSAAG